MQLTESQQCGVERLNLQARVLDLEQQVVALKIELGRVLEQAAPVLVVSAKAALRAALEQLQRDIAVAHPAYHWDPTTGQFTPRPPQ